MIRVSPRARRHEDRAGDPLDGLVNLFDLGIVLSVAFLLAALSSLHLDTAITRKATKPTPGSITAPDGSTVGNAPATGQRVVGKGSKVGSVYRLNDGRLIYVVPPAAKPTTAPRR